MKNNVKYKIGTLWKTRKRIQGIDLAGKNCSVKKDQIIYLLDYIEECFYEEHVKILYEGKIIYIANVDMLHYFKEI